MKLNTFGRPHIAREGGEEVALQPLPVAVLTYLAIGGPRDRGHLADLFWHNSKNGLNSLSTTLNRIRADVPGCLWVQGNSVVGIDIASDIDDLRDAIDRSDFEAAAQLYSAPFLGSLKIRRQSIEFEEWVLAERTTLASMVELTLLQHGRDQFDAGDYHGAAIVAERAWEIATRDGFPSPDYFETYHRILASAARPSANAVRAMAEEFGMELLPVDPVGFESGTKVPTTYKPVASSVAGDRPEPSDSASQLFGCREELDAIASSVTSHGLTTLVGIGGSGKTRLATEFFNSSSVERDFPRRYWVNLRDVADPDLVAPAIAAALGQRFTDVASLADGLAEHESALLVLDNFEHVDEASQIVEELIKGNGALRIVVTSRVPLDAKTESLVQISGLETSHSDTDSPAEQLFVASARRAGVSDERLGGSTRSVIRDVCRRVGGNPLALEIAGGWAQLLSPAEILDALSLGNELLESSVVGDLRTMEAVLNQAWSTLAEAEQNTLMLLAAFPGGCLTSEALKLSDLPIKSIGQLVQHSLIRLHVAGRITLHPLIASRARAELEQRPSLQRECQQVLSSWCQSFVTTMQLDTHNTHWRSFDAEIANFTSAWSWDAKHRLWDLHRVTLGPLREFFAESGRVREGRALFAIVAKALRADPNHQRGLLASVLEGLGWFEVLSGELAQARVLLEDALDLSPSDDPLTRAQILRSLGALQLGTGEIDDATSNFNEGLALISDESSALTASFQHYLGQAHHYRGERDEAKKAARLALQAGRSANGWEVMTRSYLLLADIEAELDPRRAIVLLNEGWAIAKEASLDQLAIYFPTILGMAHLRLNEASVAESYFTEGIDAANDVGQLATASANYVGRAEARLLREATVEASADLKTGIRLALKTGNGRYLMWAAVVSCRASAAHRGPSENVQALLWLALRHPATDQDARAKAVESLQDLFSQAPQPDVATVSDSEAANLDEVAELSLELLTLSLAEV